ncbi:hypothetical protein RJ55_07201 [Drechmeria coniospora]|nr:hypothetical protein RJ55_07201 [Drechmeria coniospora]
MSVDTLREAFSSPPKSCGKFFHIFTIYQLVRKFYDREIKTWAELMTTLGVEPPDPTKDESSQKVAQYGINSMHVNSFFKYLMDIPNDYWTNIPTDADPTAIRVRDGVAIEDDMALRSILPQIRPKRGCRSAEEEAAVKALAKRRRLMASSAAGNQYPAAQPSWPADAGGRAFALPGPDMPHRVDYDSLYPVPPSIGQRPASAVTPTPNDAGLGGNSPYINSANRVNGANGVNGASGLYTNSHCDTYANGGQTAIIIPIPTENTKPHEIGIDAPPSAQRPFQPVAICGMACRLPGGIHSPSELWSFLHAGKDARGPVPPTRYNISTYNSPDKKPGSIIARSTNDLAALATSFSIPRTEVETLDPQ